eukprot:Skav232726  [mRNA]  locus=scaffold1843:62615:79073:- [translate_table: standard]
MSSCCSVLSVQDLWQADKMVHSEFGYSRVDFMVTQDGAQTRKYQAERDRVQRGKGAKTFARWNKQELYLNEESRERAKTASRQHLQRHPELCALSSNELHLLWIDLDDLSLPPDERRSEDAFTGTSPLEAAVVLESLSHLMLSWDNLQDYCLGKWASSSTAIEPSADPEIVRLLIKIPIGYLLGEDGAVAEQLLLDAPRELFVIDGTEFHFAREASPEMYGADLDGNDLEVLKRQFGERVVAAIHAALAPAGKSLRLLMRAVSGGEQDVRFELRSCSPDGPWDLELFVRKANFRQCIIYNNSEATEDSSPRACSPSSFFLKSCRAMAGWRAADPRSGIRYSVMADGTVQVVPSSAVGSTACPCVYRTGCARAAAHAALGYECRSDTDSDDFEIERSPQLTAISQEEDDYSEEAAEEAKKQEAKLAEDDADGSLPIHSLLRIKLLGTLVGGDHG